LHQLDMTSLTAIAVALLAATATAKELHLPTVTLNNGVVMPVVAIGTGGYDNASAEAAVKYAVDSGLTPVHVHAAYDYYNLPGVAAGIATTPRSNLFLTAMTTPCIHTAANPKRNVTDPNACYELTTNELAETARLLGVASFDLVLLHGPSEPFGYEGGCGPDICAVNQAQWRAYQDFKSAGKARAIGVSNYCQSCLNCLLGDETTTVVPAVNQIQLHVGMGKDPEELLSFCASKDIVVQAYSPLAGGAIPSDQDCAKIGASYNKSGVQVGLRWVMQQSDQQAMVVKAETATFLDEDLNIFDFELSPADIATLDAKTSPSGQQDGRPSWGCAK